MAKLAIKGHVTRGKEVIEILEMLGGKNKRKYCGEYNNLWYCVDVSSEISIFAYISDLNAYNFFTLEEFFEKFPYKVGDKVKNVNINNIVGKITDAQWNNKECQVSYYVEWDNETRLSYFAKGLQPYKEVDMHDTKEEVLDFIKHFNKNKGTIKTFTEGCCYWFAFILHTRFKGTIMYDDINNHFACKINNIIYDINGINNNIFVEWDNYCKIEPLNADRIIRDCIIFETK